MDEDGNASLDGNTVTVEDTDADSVDNVLTAVLSAEKKGGVCVAKVFSQGLLEIFLVRSTYPYFYLCEYQDFCHTWFTYSNEITIRRVPEC